MNDRIRPKYSLNTNILIQNFDSSDIYFDGNDFPGLGSKIYIYINCATNRRWYGHLNAI